MTIVLVGRPTGFENLFQGIRMHICTLNINFWIPFWREILLNRGFVSADKSTICSILLQDPSHAVAVVVGGAKESLFAIPGKNTLVLKRRKGFVKIALQTGASLVPVYAFGENNMYRQIENPVFLKIQKWVTKRLSFALVSPMGRYNTLIPYARKVVTVGKEDHKRTKYRVLIKTLLTSFFCSWIAYTREKDA